ncbi:MAG: hypothetical protein N3A54_03930 [Patescibacteria group bacterium]|nr:hypothetical protein [Patescibacteria group bacterium]
MKGSYENLEKIEKEKKFSNKSKKKNKMRGGSKRRDVDFFLTREKIQEEEDFEDIEEYR